jgi:hypothetical protein
MSKGWTIGLILLAFLIGSVVGAFVADRMWTSRSLDLVAGSAAAEVNTTLYLLERARTGGAGTADFLESKLDSGIAALGTSLKSIPASHREPAHLKVLGRAREYRQRFPHSSGSRTIDKIVTDALALSGQGGN